ncbi:MAG: universal stress protein [Kofleriaceae bacterium]
MALHERILLATDLNARSDRALDRAVMIAKREDASLVVLHVVEPIPGNPLHEQRQLATTHAAIVRAQLEQDLGECAKRTTVRIEMGDPAEVIDRVAKDEQSTLLVVGVSRVERFGRFVLGQTVERLVRGVEVPLLIVTDRPRRPYERVGVAADFSPVSRQSLELALHLFPDQRITVFHASQPLATYGASDPAAYREQFRAVSRSEFDSWLAKTDLGAEARERVDVRIETGDPARALREAVEQGAFDLVVIGTKGRGRIFEFLLGSVAKDLLAQLPCDALFVRESQLPGAMATTTAAT